MLVSLHVKNLALIEEAEVYFANGLNILTGETGAGKSILIGSINLALGAKISKEMVRDPEKPALVELIFQIEKEKEQEKLQLLGLEAEDNQIILSRKIINGRSITKINGETYPAAMLKKIAEIFIDIHGQHEHQSLLYKKKHLEIVDEYAKDEINLYKNQLLEQYKEYSKCKKMCEESTLDENEKNRRVSLLNYEIEEIQNARLVPGEEESLEQKHRKLSNGKKILEAVSGVYRYTGSSNGESAAEGIERAVRELARVTDYDQRLEEFYNQLLELEGLISDFNRDLYDYQEEFTFSEEEFEEVDSRLNQIHLLKAKYGPTLEAVLEYAGQKELELEKLQDYERYCEELQRKKNEAEKALQTLSEQVSCIRKKYARLLEQEITKVLQELNFDQVTFHIEVQNTGNYSPEGMDDITFLISTNVGEPIKELGKVASGGELSRIMLAIKTVLADRDEAGTLIFDEIDVGISGRTAQKVSEKLAVIGKSRQVICITHLPQIASMADQHFEIKKEIAGEKTITSIEVLSQEESVKELARMLGGAEITDAVLENAKEMKTLAHRTKTTSLK